MLLENFEEWDKMMPIVLICLYRLASLIKMFEISSVSISNTLERFNFNIMCQ
uniref:Uncharacterized protein n=1 Tax=Ascaris lumbricoides TaxID=6252 RepID=A0A0M3HGL5_ASCLU